VERKRVLLQFSGHVAVDQCITAVVLGYRLVHITGGPSEALISALTSVKIDSIIQPFPLSMKDGLAGVAYVRKNAAQYNINPERIGLMGFTVGGQVAMSVAYNATYANRPNFIAPIYAWKKNIVNRDAPVEKVPAFIVVASDNPLNLIPTRIEIYNKWKAANQKAEVIIYQNGGHGFGIGKETKLSDTWIDRFEEWLEANRLLKQE
jgi:acetyl esterase/lipase